MMLNINKHERALLMQALSAWRAGVDPSTAGDYRPSRAQRYACALVTADIDAMLARLKALQDKEAA